MFSGGLWSMALRGPLKNCKTTKTTLVGTFVSEDANGCIYLGATMENLGNTFATANIL